MQGGMKNDDFQPISRFISEMMQYSAIWKANWKPHPNFRMVPALITLSDL